MDMDTDEDVMETQKRKRMIMAGSSRVQSEEVSYTHLLFLCIVIIID